jgi:hypothetical protein
VHMKLPTPKVVQHLVTPGYEQARGLPLHGETVSEFLDRVGWDVNRIPTICVIDGLPVLRSEWSVTRADTQQVWFVSRPHGGGSSGGGSKALQIGGIVAMIALAAAAPWAAGLLAPIIGISSTAGIAALTAGIALGGGMLISTVINMVAGGQNKEEQDDAAQVYSLQAASNSARPLGVIPVNYGRQKRLPDYGSQPWSEYIGNEQYMNLQLTIGVGKHEIEQILISDSLFWDDVTGVQPQFTDVQIEFCPPGTPITIFPTNVEQSTEVSGQELPGPNPAPDTWVGPFVANASGTDTYRLVFDVVLPGGLYRIQSDGTYLQWEVHITAEAREINDAGTPIGSWTVVLDTTIINRTKTPQRMSFPVEMASARYEVRMNRSDLPNGGVVVTGGEAGYTRPGDSDGSTSYTIQQYDGDEQLQNQINWLGLRAYIVGSSTFEHEYNIAIRLKADAQLSSQSSAQFGVIATRILPVWNGTTFVEEPTRNPLWAFYDAATNTLYGAKRPASKIDFQAVYAAALAADTRGDTFNYSFTEFVAVPEALDTILASARSKHCWIGDILSVVRDEWHEIPSMLLTDHHIVRGSLEIISIFNDETGVDCVIGEFLNETTWRPAEIQFPPNTISFTAENPSRVRIPGVTDPEHMLREVGFTWSQSQLRRTKVNLTTGHEGQMLKMLSSVAVQSHLPNTWGQSGEVVSLAVDGVTITTDKDLVFSGSSTNYVEFRDKRGRYFGPIICDSVGAQPTKLELDASDLALVETQQGMTIEQALDRMDGAEPPVFVLGVQSNLSRHCLLLQARPNGDTVDLVMVVDDEAVHDDDYGDVGDFPEPPPVLNPNVPFITSLTAVFSMAVAEATLQASWWPAPGAIGYIAQISYDDGLTWEGIYEGSAPGFSKTVTAAELKVRVQAYHTVKGPWSIATVDAPVVVVAPDVVPPSALIDGLEDYVMNILKDNEAVGNSIRQFITNTIAELDAQHWANQSELRRNLSVTYGNITAEYNEAITVAVGPEGALAEQLEELSVSIDGVEASVTTLTTVVGTIEGHLAASWGLTLDVNNYITGMYLLNDGTTSAFVINTDNFSIAKPGVLTPTTIFSIQTVDGVSTMALKGDFIADGVITARTIDVVSLSAVSADLGTVTVGKIESTDGKFLIDATNKRIVISD